MVGGEVVPPFFWSFLGRKPPCCDVRFVRSGRGGALHVSWILSESFCTRSSSFMHDDCHWSCVIWSFLSILVSSFN